MTQARAINAWSSHANATPATYAPVPRTQSQVLHEAWNASKNHWMVMLGPRVLCDCGARDEACKRCQKGRW